MTPGAFSALESADWAHRADAVWREEDGKFEPNMNRALVGSLSGGDSDEVRLLWRELSVLRSVPGLLIRGETSPVMTADLAGKIRKAHGDMEELVAEGQGFVPSLDKPDLTDAVVRFLRG